MALIRNLPKIRSMMVPEPAVSQDPNAPQVRTNYGQLIEEAFNDVQKQLSNVSIQTNASLSAPTNTPPPTINGLQVDGGAGMYHVYITDNNENLYRGVEYTAEYSQTADFSQFHVEHLGPARDKRIDLGISGPLYWRAYSGYGPASPPSSPVYHGGSQAVAVTAGGSQPPSLRAGQGSGTNAATEGAGGYGAQPWRGNSPPRRGEILKPSGAATSQFLGVAPPITEAGGIVIAAGGGGGGGGVGPTGPAGATGPTGATGPGGISGTVGYIAQFATSDTIEDSIIDYGVTTPGGLTSNNSGAGGTTLNDTGGGGVNLQSDALVAMGAGSSNELGLSTDVFVLIQTGSSGSSITDSGGNGVSIVDSSGANKGLTTGPVISPSQLFSVAGTALPAANSVPQGTEAWVSDATTPTSTGLYAGGGTQTCIVISDGTNWYVLPVLPSGTGGSSNDFSMIFELMGA